MKELKLTCKKCGAEKIIKGEEVINGYLGFVSTVLSPFVPIPTFWCHKCKEVAVIEIS